MTTMNSSSVAAALVVILTCRCQRGGGVKIDEGPGGTLRWMLPDLVVAKFGSDQIRQSRLSRLLDCARILTTSSMSSLMSSAAGAVCDFTCRYIIYNMLKP